MPGISIGALTVAGAAAWFFTARRLYARWHGNLRKRGGCSCGHGCPECLVPAGQVAAAAMAAALVFPLVWLAVLVRWRQPAAVTERLTAIEREREVVEAATRRLDEAKAAMWTSRAAWTTEAERELGIGEHGN